MDDQEAEKLAEELAAVKDLTLEEADELPIVVQWMKADDIEDVLDIDRRQYADQCPAVALKQFMSTDGHYARIATRGPRLVGYSLLETTEDSVFVSRLAVHPEDTRCGIGSALIADVLSHLDGSLRHTAVFIIRERNTEALLFLKHAGFVPRKIVRDAFGWLGQNGILMKQAVRLEEVTLEELGLGRYQR